MATITLTQDGVFISDEKNIKKERNKGKSLIEFPKDYTVIDIETTGFDNRFDEIIEIAALRYRDDKLVDSYSTLIKPHSYFEFDEESDIDYCIVDGCKVQYITDFIVNKTGITNEMISNGAVLKLALEKFYKFIDSDILIGHNVNFDINFLYDSLEKELNVELRNDFIDTMRISKKLFPNFGHHRLSDLIEYYNIDSKLHRSYDDSSAAFQVYINMKKNILEAYESFDEFKKLFKRKRKARVNYYNNLDVRDIVPDENANIDEDSPIYNKIFVFTGVLEKMSRKDAMQIVVNLGGINGNSVTKKTNYLVLGCNDYCSSIKDGKSSKQKKAEKYILEGLDINIISENVFYDMINF